MRCVDLTHCPHCGNEIEPDDMFCPYCGTNLRIVKMSQSTLPSKTISLTLDHELVETFSKLEEQIRELDGVDEELKVQNQHMDELGKRVSALETEFKRCKFQEKKEEEDYRKLKGFSFAHLMAKIKGNYEEQLGKEELEYLNVVAKCNEIKEALSQTRDQFNRAKEQYNDLRNLMAHRISLMEDQKRLVSQIMEGVSHPEEDRLEAEVAEARTQYNQFIEQRRKVERVYHHLRTAEQYFIRASRALDSAMGMSTWDMFGGGFLTDMAKNSNLSRARREVQMGERELQAAYQLDPSLPRVSRANVTGPQSLDLFFDNIFTDMAARNRIERSRNSLNYTLQSLQPVIYQVRSKLDQIVKEHEAISSLLQERERALFDIRVKLIRDSMPHENSGKKAF